MKRQNREFILVYRIFGARHTRPRGAGLLHSLLCLMGRKGPSPSARGGDTQLPLLGRAPLLRSAWALADTLSPAYSPDGFLPISLQEQSDSHLHA